MSEEMHINNDIFRRKLVRLVLPIAFQQFMLAIVSASDALMLGKVEQESLAAVSLAGQVTFVQNLFLGAMTIGWCLIIFFYLFCLKYLHLSSSCRSYLFFFSAFL